MAAGTGYLSTPGANRNLQTTTQALDPGIPAAQQVLQILADSSNIFNTSKRFRNNRSYKTRR